MQLRKILIICLYNPRKNLRMKILAYKLKANFIMIKRYLEIKMTQLKLYMINLDDLEREIDLAINN